MLKAISQKKHEQRHFTVFYLLLTMPSALLTFQDPMSSLKDVELNIKLCNMSKQKKTLCLEKNNGEKLDKLSTVTEVLTKSLTFNTSQDPIAWLNNAAPLNIPLYH